MWRKLFGRDDGLPRAKVDAVVLERAGTGASEGALAEGVGVESEELVVFGRPGQTILAAAEELGADTIVLGAEGMSRLEHAFVGSVSEEVLRHANRTVLVVGGQPQGDPEDSTGPGK